MQRTSRRIALQTITRTTAIEDKPPATASRPAAFLFVTGAASQIQPMKTWRNTAAELNKGSETLNSEDFDGNSEEEVLGSLYDKASQMRQQNLVDGQTYIVFTAHGTKIGGAYRLCLELKGRKVYVNADAAVSVLRKALGAKNVVFLACCFGGNMRQALADIGGDTFVLVGKKAGLSTAANNTIAQAIEVMGRTGRGKSATSKAHLKRIWQTLQATTGENIAWITDGEIRKHNALRALADANPKDEIAQLKRVQVGMAKIWHGSLKGVQEAIGPESLGMLREHLRATSESPLSHASESENELDPRRESGPKIDYLIETLREDVNEILDSKIGQTVLHQAASSWDAQTLLRLVQHGANILKVDHKNTMPLHRAALSLRDTQSKIQILLNADPDRLVDRPGMSFNFTALHIAVMGANVEAVRTLLCCGADPEARSPSGTTIDTCLKTLQDPDAKKQIAALLTEFGAAINRLDKAGTTALHTQAAQGTVDAVQDLLKKGASVHRRDKSGALPIHRWAENAATSTLDVLDPLLKAGTDVNATDLAGKSALHYAARAGNTLALITLLIAGADPCLPDHQGGLPIHHANQDMLEALQLQMQMEGRPPGNSAPAAPPLKLNRVGASSKHVREMAQLVTLPGALERRDGQGRTPLAEAVLNGNEKAARYLLKKDAEINIRLTDGRSLLQHAQDAHLDHMVQLLLGFEAKRDW